MTKLTTEITIEELQYRIHAHENDLTQMWTADYFLNVQKELLASKQSAKNSADLKTLVISEISDFYAGFESPGEPETVDEAQSQLIERIEKVFGLAAPVLPKQPEPVALIFENHAFTQLYKPEEIEIAKRTQKEAGGTITELFKGMPAQPVTAPKPLGYFSYGSEHGFDWHKTEKEAIESAEDAIDDYRGDACDGWSEETDSVCWGVILQQATKVNERPRTDDDNDNIAPHIDTVCDYALLPAQESE